MKELLKTLTGSDFDIEFRGDIILKRHNYTITLKRSGDNIVEGKLFTGDILTVNLILGASPRLLALYNNNSLL